MIVQSKLKSAIIVSLAFTLVGCTAVELTPDGNKVRVLTPSEVSSCREMGKTRASVTAKTMGIDRSANVIGKELETVAQNSAADMGGDTIVALTIVENGKQTYVVYKCIDPNN